MKYLLISRWWGNQNGKYAKFAKRWAHQCKKLKLNFVLEEEQEYAKKQYQVGLNNKAGFILTMLLKHKQPVVYTDVDMKLHRKPDLFLNKDNVDFMCFNWNFEPRVTDIIDPRVCETSSGLLYFNYSPKAIKLLRLWNRYLQLKSNYLRADDRVLSVCMFKTKACKWLKTKWLPYEYYYLPGYFKEKASPVVVSHPHMLTEEQKATKDSHIKNRVPKEYAKIPKSVKEYKDLGTYLKSYKEPHYKTLKKLLLNR